MKLRSLFGLGLAVAALLSGTAGASTITFAGGAGNLAASASFTQTGNQLEVVLTNTSGVAALVPADVLTGVYFSFTGSLTKVSALLAPGSTVYYDPEGQPAGGNVGGEFAYKSGISTGTLAGATAGISSSGLGLFGPGDIFGGPNLAGPVEPDGVQYGILASTVSDLANNGIKNSGGMISNAVVFTFTVSDDFLLSSLGHMYFQYGTALTEPHFSGACIKGACNNLTVPEPASIALLGLGLVGLTAMRRRKSGKA